MKQQQKRAIEAYLGVASIEIVQYKNGTNIKHNYIAEDGCYFIAKIYENYNVNGWQYYVVENLSCHSILDDSLLTTYKIHKNRPYCRHITPPFILGGIQ